MRIIFAAFILLIVLNVQSQIVVKPNYGIKSHEVLNIDSIINSESNTIVFLSAVVPEAGSPFCVNKSTYLRGNNSGMKYNMIRTRNVSLCPSSKVYKNAGERFIFELIFPKIDTTLKCIDLIEDCNDACFYFKGIILDKSFNKEIEEAYSSYSKNSSLAMEKFKLLINAHPEYMYGFAYINIIKILAEKNEMKQAHEWYSKMNSSLLLDKPELDEIIKKQPYYNLIK